MRASAQDGQGERLLRVYHRARQLRVAARGEKAGVPSAAGGEVQNRAARRDQRGEAKNPGQGRGGILSHGGLMVLPHGASVPALDGRVKAL